MNDKDRAAATLLDWAERKPDELALVVAETGQSMRYAELGSRARSIASWLIVMGLDAGDGIAFVLENRLELIELACAARLAGLYYTPVSTHLAPDEVRHVLRDSGSRLVVVSPSTLHLLQPWLTQSLAEGLRVFMLDEGAAGLPSFEVEVARADATTELPPRPLGRDLLYSGGTTGRPKGVRRAMVPHAERHRPDLEVEAWRRSFHFDEHAVYLSTAPLYHAAPLRYVLRILDCGGRCVLMTKFDPELALALIERERITHSQWVPTMFVRLLRLPPMVRSRYDLSSQRVAIHAAAPCPIDVKRAMLAWWGEVVYEFYAGSEGAGATSITPTEWLQHPGSVGRAMAGSVHIVDDDGHDLPAGQVGNIYFSGLPPFAYLNDPEKTREAYNDRGWATYGDVGSVDAQGYLYLSDRRADLIISGGVNIYPREIEEVLARHPAVDDAAVVGVPHGDLGEVPKALVLLRDPALASGLLAHELIAHCAAHLARLKLPRTVVFAESLPRLPTGKLLRRVLKEQYRSDPDAGHAVRLRAETAPS